MDAAQQPCRAVYLQCAGKLRRPKSSGGQDTVHTDAMRYFKRLVLHRIFHRRPFKGNRFFRRQNHSKYDIQHHDRDGKAKNEAAVALKPVLFPTQHTVSSHRRLRSLCGPQARAEASPRRRIPAGCRPECRKPAASHGRRPDAGAVKCTWPSLRPPCPDSWP